MLETLKYLTRHSISGCNC